jgi:hypothetical protein
MTVGQPNRAGSDAHARARTRLDAASSERARLCDERERARGTSRELQADTLLLAADDEVSARERWLQWVEERQY